MLWGQVIILIYYQFVTNNTEIPSPEEGAPPLLTAGIGGGV